MPPGSPHQNRVTPTGDLIATPERGLVFGNRGCLHDASGRIRRQWAVKRWISCRLDFKSRRRRILQPGRYTELFFLDEATALAAGHRPCAECRAEDYRRLSQIWASTYGERGATAIDERLHVERIDPDGVRRLHRRPMADLPDATMISLDGDPWLVLGHSLRRWTPAGYTDARSRTSNEATVITPPSLVALLAAGPWTLAVPLLHPSAG